jgi:ATP-dependent RNA helicase SUPV3L1/SUV3
VEDPAAAGVEPPSAESVAASGDPGSEPAAEPQAAEPVMLEIWRQGRRPHREGGQARHGRGRDRRHEGRQEGRPRAGEQRGERPQGERPQRHHRADRGERRGEHQGEGANAHRPPRGNRPDHRSDGRRDGSDRKREDRREKQPDPNSPFAKLMALKAQLEDPNNGKR